MSMKMIRCDDNFFDRKNVVMIMIHISSVPVNTQHQHCDLFSSITRPQTPNQPRSSDLNQTLLIESHSHSPSSIVPYILFHSTPKTKKKSFIVTCELHSPLPLLPFSSFSFLFSQPSLKRIT